MSKTTHVTPGAVLKRLLSGNRRFVSGRMQHPDQGVRRRRKVLSGQSPLAVVIGCSDSRVPPEIIFDQGFGSLFIVRTAGHVLDDAAVGSVEYAVHHLHVPLILVLGHADCGAVKAAMLGASVKGPLGKILRAIAPSIRAARSMEGHPLRNATMDNINRVVELLVQHLKPHTTHRGTSGPQVLGAYYDLASGQVELVGRAF